MVLAWPAVEEVARHWEAIFEAKADDQVSWFQAQPATSLRLLGRWSPERAALVDVGAGSSRLVDRLLDAGWSDLTVLDVSGVALAKVADRLGQRAEAVSFACCDLRTWRPSRRYTAWHDRAMFHFLVDPRDRDRYIQTVAQAVRPGGVAVLATFAADGPTGCSGLPTCRYSSEDLGSLFAPAFGLDHAEREEHRTPSGAVQAFSWVVLRRR